MKSWYVAVGSMMMFALAVPEGLDSCSIGEPEPVFQTRQHPADLRRAYLEGKLGILAPSYQTKHLIEAYRVMHGARLPAEEIDSVFKTRQSSHPANYPMDAFQQWKNVRDEMHLSKPTEYLVRDKQIHEANTYSSYLNCNDHAFVTATETLRQRSAKWGAQSQNLQDWLAAQDQVFSNCGNSKPVIPDALPVGSDTLLEADRQYQIAAALFYADDFGKAREAFQVVAGNQKSPWRSIAPYMIARCYLREGTVANKADSLLRARTALQGVLDDPIAKALHDSARKLLEFIAARENPIGRLNQMEASLLNPQAADSAADLIADYDFLYHSVRDNRKLPAAEIAKAGEMTEWLLSIEVQGCALHCLDKWRQTKRPEWLVAALLGAPADAEATNAARTYPPAEPAYETVTYYGVRQEKSPAVRRAWLDEALSRDLSVSTRNALFGERMRVAQNEKEFLKFAPRLPEAHMELFDGSENETDIGFSSTTPLFDEDAARAFNSALPLSEWIRAAYDPTLAPGLQLEVAEAAWVRAVLLQQTGNAKKAMERIAQSKPEAKPYLDAKTAEESQVDAVFLLLRQLDLAPFVAAQKSGGRDLTNFSDLGAGRWAFARGCDIQRNSLWKPEGSFPSQESIEQARKECQDLQTKAPVGANWLAIQTMQWAKARPDDPRLPQALHLVVQATRRGSVDQNTRGFSKAAFDLLHRQYPKSEWTAKTKYWY